MASSLVGQFQVTTFTSPIPGTSPIDANVCRGNANTLKTAYDSHDNSAILHFQDSTAGARPAAGTVGRKWLDNDTFRVYYDDGTNWQEIAYAVSGGAGSFTSVTFTTFVKSVTALATPSALAATQFTAFASTVNGAVIMGFGTTYDVALMNRAGTVVLGVGPNTTAVSIPGSLVLTGATVTGTPTWSSSQAITISTATQASITTMANLTTVGALNAGSITSGFGSIDVGADAISGGAISGTTGAFSGTVDVTGDAVGYRWKNTATTSIGFLSSVFGWTGAGSKTDAAIASFGTNLVFYTGGSGTASLTLGVAGAALFAGALTGITTAKLATTLGVGAASPAASGSGVTFPAAQSASTDVNTLDDYEEGAWTPSIGGSATYATQTGRYRKVGKTVWFSGQLNITSRGTGSTGTVSGLPFTSDSVTGQMFSIGYFANSGTNTAFMSGSIASGATTFTIIGQGAIDASCETINPIQDTFLMYFAGEYEASA